MQKHIQEVPPYIVSIEQALMEYTRLANPAMSKEIFTVRMRECGLSAKESAAPYVPDSLEDRELLKRYKQVPNPAAEFGLFRQRMRKGWDFDKAISTPPRQKNGPVSTKSPRKKSSLRLAYEQAPCPPAVSLKTFYARVKKCGWSVEKALRVPVV